MRGLGLIIGYILGNEMARKWCLDNLKKASVILDKEMKKTPIFKNLSSPEKKNGDSDIKNILATKKPEITEREARHDEL